MKQWFLIENETEYNEAIHRYETIRNAKKGDNNYKELMLLVKIISEYEKEKFAFPELDPIEFIKIRMEDFGYKAADLAKEYGDKGTISKVLSYKQPLSLTMIRKFSKLLQIPAEALIKEYKLQ